MENIETVHSAFQDELEKIAFGASMGTGRARSGIRPVKAQSLASKTGLAAKGVGKFFKRAAAPNPKHVGAALVSGAALGLYGERKIKKLHQDYQIGRQLRKQGM